MRGMGLGGMGIRLGGMVILGGEFCVFLVWQDGG